MQGTPRLHQVRFVTRELHRAFWRRTQLLHDALGFDVEATIAMTWRSAGTRLADAPVMDQPPELNPRIVQREGRLAVLIHLWPPVAPFEPAAVAMVFDRTHVGRAVEPAGYWFVQ